MAGTNNKDRSLASTLHAMARQNSVPAAKGKGDTGNEKAEKAQPQPTPKVAKSSRDDKVKPYISSPNNPNRSKVKNTTTTRNTTEKPKSASGQLAGQAFKKAETSMSRDVKKEKTKRVRFDDGEPDGAKSQVANPRDRERPAAKQASVLTAHEPAKKIGRAHPVGNILGKSPQELAEIVERIELLQNLEFNKMKRLPRLRSVEVRPGVQLSLKLEPNIIAAMAYMKGSEIVEPCNRCALEFGSFAKCVVLPGVMNGACAGCHYRGNGKKCSFYPTDSKLNLQNKSAKQHADDIETRENVNNEAFNRMKNAPRNRDLEIRPNIDRLDLQRDWNATSAMAYLKGNIQDPPCTRCSQGYGPFEKCVVVDAELGGACAGCYYSYKMKQCSFLHESEKKQGETAGTSSTLVQLAPETRKRKADTIEDVAIVEPVRSVKKQRVEKNDKRWTKAMKKLERDFDKAKEIQQKLGSLSVKAEDEGSKAKEQLRELGVCLDKLYETRTKLQDLVKTKNDED